LIMQRLELRENLALMVLQHPTHIRHPTAYLPFLDSSNKRKVIRTALA
jgi:hypothetical protein